ncbi:MAG TPA: hypothetical protein PLX89_15905 [Verrucomicrobiota bacterium]|nr:hypothetical protein [Verrucomicrobiales bacterium]HRI14480.1 hypothetical protein [Verrucomicrobiota bacterium]
MSSQETSFLAETIGPLLVNRTLECAGKRQRDGALAAGRASNPVMFSRDPAHRGEKAAWRFASRRSPKAPARFMAAKRIGASKIADFHEPALLERSYHSVGAPLQNNQSGLVV